MSKINGPKGYERGRENALAFLARKPSSEEQKNHWNSSSPPLDDYDRGYRDVLQESRHNGR